MEGSLLCRCRPAAAAAVRSLRFAQAIFSGSTAWLKLAAESAERRAAECSRPVGLACLTYRNHAATVSDSTQPLTAPPHQDVQRARTRLTAQ